MVRSRLANRSNCGPVLRQLIGEEVLCRSAFAVVEIPRVVPGGDQLLEPHPCHDHMSRRLEVDRRVRKGGGDVARGPQRRGDVDQSLHRFAQILRVGRGALGLQRCVDGLVDPLRQQGQPRAVGHHDLAAQQIQAVDAVRAFVDRVQSVVAVALFDVELLGVSVSAVDLDGQAVGLEAPLRRPALGDRSQDVEQQVCALAVGPGAGAPLVHQHRAIQAERERAFDIGLLRQQHSLDVCVFDQCHLRAGRVLGVDGSALGALSWRTPPTPGRPAYPVAVACNPTAMRASFIMWNM